MPEQQQQMQVDFTQVVNELANRMRILEGKQSMGQEKLLVMNQNMITEYKKLLKEIKAIDAEVKDMRKEMANLKNVVKHLTEEAGQFARESDVKVLEKYIKLWDPLKFATVEDVEAIVAKTINKPQKRTVKKKENGNASKRSVESPEEGDEQ